MANELDDATWRALAEAATEACAHAHAPYSHLRIGAAVLTSAGSIFAGCNVENVSYGLTMCAERNAAAAAICGSEGPRVLVACYLVSDPPGPAPPCGACRQVLKEFGNPLVSFEGPDGRQTSALAELLPFPF